MLVNRGQQAQGPPRTRLVGNEGRGTDSKIIPSLHQQYFGVDVRKWRHSLARFFSSLFRICQVLHFYVDYIGLLKNHQVTNERFHKHRRVCILGVYCQPVTSKNLISLKYKFSVVWKTICIVFLIMWIMVKDLFPLGEKKSLFLSPMVLTWSQRLKGNLGW